MAIRDIVTRGYGNGTYDPGVNDIPTRGYSIGVAVIPEPIIAAACQIARPWVAQIAAVYRGQIADVSEKGAPR